MVALMQIGTTVQWLSTASDVIVAIAAIFAGVAGVRGLTAWKQQLTGKVEYDLARSLLRSVFQLRDAITSARNPFVQYSETPDLPEEKLKALSIEEKRWHALTQAYQKRWDPIHESMTVVDANTLEAEVVWGENVEKKVKEIRKLVGELRWAIGDYLEGQNPNEAQGQRNPDTIAERMSILFARGKVDQDPYQQKLENAIKAIEDQIRPTLKRYHAR
ncbi:MAG: hypothetical protein WD044_11725 [Dongiaceae bacterium]